MVNVMASEDEAFMREALLLADEAGARGEVPVGAVVAQAGAIIGRGFNAPISSSDPTAHAEVRALRAAALQVQNYRLPGCTLYVTLEPCAMCAGAIVLARIPTLVFGSYDPKAGACGTLFNIVEDKRLNHRVHVIGGVCDAESEALLKRFFGRVRSI